MWSEGDGGDVGGGEGGELIGLLEEAGPPLLERGAPCPRVGDELHRPLHLRPKRDRERGGHDGGLTKDGEAKHEERERDRRRKRRESESGSGMGVETEDICIYRPR